MDHLNLPRSLYVCTFKASDLKPKIKKLQHFLEHGTLASFSGQHGYKFLARALNRHLFSLLDDCGFWDFHSTNHQKMICSIHQVVLYAYKGYRYFLLGYTCPAGTYEIHHLDHDPSNNDLDNLVYVTPQENQILASITRMSYHSNARSAHIGTFGRRTPKTHFAKLARTTFIKTFNRLGFSVPSTSVADWLMTLPADLGSRLISFWLHLPKVLIPLL